MVMRRYWLQWLTVVTLAVMLMTLTGCRSVKYVPVTEYRDRYVSKTDSFIKTDSVYLHDSVSVFVRGDTIFTTKTRYKDRLKYIYNTKTDTVAVHDSIPYPVKVEVEVEKKQSAIDKLLTGLGKIAGMLLVVFAVLIVYNLVRKH
mgnify:CR=1 FL=1